MSTPAERRLSDRRLEDEYQSGYVTGHHHALQGKDAWAAQLSAFFFGIACGVGAVLAVQHFLVP